MKNYGLEAAARCAWESARTIRGFGAGDIGAARGNVLALSKARNPHLRTLATDAAAAHAFMHEWKHPGDVVSIS